MPKLEITVTSADVLDVRRFILREELNHPFVVDVWARSRNASIDLDANVGFTASFRAESQHAASPLGGVRELTGLLDAMELVEAEPGALSTYRLRLIPALSALDLRSNLRLFQDATIPAMVESLLAEWKLPFEWQLQGKRAQVGDEEGEYRVLALRTQYQESDLAFVHRLLEEAGIAYTFDHQNGQTRILLNDAFTTAAPRPGPIPFYATPNPKDPIEYVTKVRIARKQHAPKVSLTDYDPLRPDFDLSKDKDQPATPPWKQTEHREYDANRSVALATGNGDTPFADDRGPYRHSDTKLQQEAELSLSALTSHDTEVSFELATIDLHPGMTFEISEHPALEGVKLLCTRRVIEGDANTDWVTRCVAVPAKSAYRPPRRTRRPRAVGMISAVVVGPDKGEIHVDEHGRVRVQFLFDRTGVLNERSSPWIRVSQLGAGAQMGFMALPRVGQEVLVDFFDGDPDSPVVLGRVFNRGQPVVFKLPDHADRSAIRTSKSPGGAGWSEVVFDDKSGEELFYFQSEHNVRAMIEHDAKHTTGARRVQEVGTDVRERTIGNRTQETRGERVDIVDGRRVEETKGKEHRLKIVEDSFDIVEQDRLSTTVESEHAIVCGSRFELVAKNNEVRTGSRIEGLGALSRSVGGSIGIAIGEKGKYLAKATDAHFIAGDDIVLDAPDITIKGGGGFIRIDPSGVTIQGSIVKINAGGAAGDGCGVGVSGAKTPKEAIIPEPARPEPLPPAGLGNEIPAGPEPPVKVRILGATGLGQPCPLIPKGKTHTYVAVGIPDGGTFKWKVKPGVTIQGADNTDRVTVEGTNTSGSVDGTEIEVEYTVPQGAATDTKKLTVFEITSIEARLRATPCLRDGTRADVMPAKSSNKDDKTFDATAVTVVRECGELKLKAVSLPADVPINWTVERAADDAATLSGLPSHAQAPGGSHERKLRLDATGSFHVHGFVDCDSDGKRGPDDAGKILNVNIVEASVLPGAQNNRQNLRDTQFTAAPSNASNLIVQSGQTTVPAHYTDALFLVHAQSAKLGIRLLGGGADGLRGTDKIGAGYVQVATGDTFKGVYSNGKVITEVIIKGSTPAGFTVTTGALTLENYPIRDTRQQNFAGYGTFIIGSTDKEQSTIPEGGQKRILRMIDSPQIVLPMNHPGAAGTLQSIAGANLFKIMASVFSSDFDENFTTLASASWRLTFGTFTAGSGWTNPNAHVSGDTELRVHHPVEQSERTPAFERCPPNFVDQLRLDAR